MLLANSSNMYSFWPTEHPVTYQRMEVDTVDILVHFFFVGEGTEIHTSDNDNNMVKEL